MTRSDAIARVHARLTASGYPRGVVLVIIALSGGIAFLFSAGLLALGLGQMGTRYFLATLVGYGTFLLSIRVWIAYRRGFDDKVDVASDIANSVPDAGARVQVDEGLSQAIGYRAVHLVIRLEGLPVEVQVRFERGSGIVGPSSPRNSPARGTIRGSSMEVDPSLSAICSLVCPYSLKSSRNINATSCVRFR